MADAMNAPVLFSNVAEGRRHLPIDLLHITEVLPELPSSRLCPSHIANFEKQQLLISEMIQGTKRGMKNVSETALKGLQVSETILV